jgi:serine/threonine-protein kinase
MAQLMFKIANEPTPDILQYNPNLPPAFVSFRDKALAKDADERFQDGDSFAAALRAATGGGVAAQKPQGGDEVDISL